MPLAAVIGAALTTGAAHPWGLFVGSQDVATSGGIIGTSADTIEITEAGPGGVSSMSFLVDDPTKAFGISQGAEVSYWDLVNNVCLFRGWVDHYDSYPDFGGQGRTFKVECVGIEAILDWTIIPPAISLPFGVNSQRQVAVLANTYAPQLRAPFDASGTASPPWTRSGSFAYPMGNLKRPAEPSFWTQQFSVLLSTQGGTLRSEIARIVQAAGWMDLGTAVVTFGNVLYTVDFLYGLRSWEDDPTLQPDDYTTLTVTDTYAGTTNAAGLSATVDWAGVIRSVYVAGGNAAGSGLFSDGTGIYGPSTLISDSTVLTVADAAQRAAGMIATQSATVRGSFRLEDFIPASTVHAGSLVSITDAATGLATTYRITEIRKTFESSGNQTWTVTFGGLAAASGARLLRRFTRATLN